MAGISSKAAGSLENKYKFNGGTERDGDLGINLDETDFRLYDAQIGKFLQIDPLSDYFESYSPYTYVVDNPISYADPLGLSLKDPKKFTLPEVVVVSNKHPKKRPPSAGTTPVKLPEIKPKIEPTHNDNLVNRSPQPVNLPDKREIDNGVKDFLELVSNAAERGELITEVTGSESLYKSFKGAGYVATATTFGYQLIQGDIKGAAWTGAEAALSAAIPEYNVFKIGGSIFTSKFTLSEAYFDAQARKMDLIRQANEYPLSSSGHSRLIRAANQEHLAMVGIIKMRLLQLSDQSK
jgi:RHS repeat-associated protein